MFYYYAWRYIGQTKQPIRWNPGHVESLDAILAAQVEMWNSNSPSCFIICIGAGSTPMRAKDVHQMGVLAYRLCPKTGVPQLVFQSGVEIRVLREGSDIRKPESLNLLPPSLQRGEDEHGG